MLKNAYSKSNNWVNYKKAMELRPSRCHLFFSTQVNGFGGGAVLYVFDLRKAEVQLVKTLWR